MSSNFQYRRSPTTRKLSEQEKELLQRHLEFLKKVEIQLRDLDVNNKDLDWLKEAGNKNQSGHSPVTEAKRDEMFSAIASSALKEIGTIFPIFTRQLPEVLEAKELINKILDRGTVSNSSIRQLNSKMKRIMTLVESMAAYFGAYKK